MNQILPLAKKHVVQLLILLMLGVSCAKPVAPTGGPKDVSPPEIVKTSPPNLSTKFTGNEIVLNFNEFISLKDINSQLIISPPIKELPEFRTKGKSLVIKFKESWRNETTYNIFLGDAIVDITEGNSLSGYKFTFSTGEVLDSMIINGNILNAFNLTPVKGAFVMLYDSVYDSVPYKQLPYYIAKTKENGDFELTNLRDRKFLIFALTDLNANYLFDSNNEEISFLDSLVSPWNETLKIINPTIIGQDKDSINQAINKNSKEKAVPDTPVEDSVIVALLKNDSIAVIDTISKHSVNNGTAPKTDSLSLAVKDSKSLILFHFKEADSVQSLVKTQLLKQNVISFLFKVPVKQPKFEILNDNSTINTSIGYNTGRDSLTMWLPGYDKDSIKIKVSDQWRILDTVELSVKPREKSIKKNEGKIKPVLKISNNIAGGRIKPKSALRLTFADPLESYDLGRLILKEDSIVINPSLNFTDSLKKQLEIKYNWKEGILYSLIIPDSSMVGIMGTNNDSTSYTFMTLKEEETAKLSLYVDLPENTPYIIQLLDTKEKLLSQYLISADMTIEFAYLAPGKYKIKAIDDKNGNGYWDTGKYLAKRYPERVIYFNKELDLRANWTMEETWNIPESNK